MVRDTEREGRKTGEKEKVRDVRVIQEDKKGREKRKIERRGRRRGVCVCVC